MNGNPRPDGQRRAGADHDLLASVLAANLARRAITMFVIEAGSVCIPDVSLSLPAARLLRADGLELEDTEHPIDRIALGDHIDHELFRLFVETGESHYLELSTVAPFGHEHATLVASDVTSSHRTTAELQRLVEIDDLTGLANRRALMNRLSGALHRHRHAEDELAVLAINLDGYRALADATGSDITRMIVQEAARRLTTVTREDELVAFLGGDRFVVLIEPVADPRDAIAAAERIRRAINAPMTFGRRDFAVSASIGVAFNTRRTEEPKQLLDDAETAVAEAKDQGRNSWAVFDDALRTRTLTLRRAEDTIDDALRRNLIAVHFQPIVDATTRAVVSFEALARINSGNGSLLPPAAFLPVAEATGRARAIDMVVLDQSCDEALRLIEISDDQRLTVSANLTSDTARRADLHSTVLEAAEEYGLEARRLVLELPESIFFDMTTATRAALEELRADGVGIAVDGHGTGPLGLPHLATFPVSQVKLDSRFVQGVGSSATDRAVVRAAVAQAHALGMEVVAKGVETPEQVTVLTELGCDRLQGFYFGHPMSGPDAELFLFEH